MSVAKQFNRIVEFNSTQPIVGNSGGAVYIAGGLNVSNLNVSNNVTIANLTITNNLFTSTGSTLLSSQWVNIPSGISFTSGNVGIGTTSPGFTLDVSGGARITGGLTTGTLTTIIGASIPNLLSSVITTSSLLATNFINSTNITTVNLVASFTSLGNLTSSTGTFANKVGGSQTVGTIVVTTSANLSGNTNTIGNLFTTGGNVGVGTVTPAFTLDVVGTGRFTNLTSTTNTIGTLNNTNLISTNSSVSSLNVVNLLSTNSISAANVFSNAITTTNLVASFTSLGNLTSSTGTFANKVGGSQTVGTIVVTTSASLIGNTNTLGNLFTTGGNVGINTTSPGVTLDVIGTGRFTNLTSTTNTLTNLIYTNATGTSLNLSGLFTTNLSTTNLSTTNLSTTNVIITNNSTLGNILNCVGLNVGNSGTPDTSRQSMINLFRNVTGGVQNAVSAELDLGSNAATTNGISTLDFKLSSFPGTINNFGRSPDNVVMSLVGNGNVGINNTNPSFNLDVAGTVRFAGTNAAPQLLLNNTNTVSYIQSQFFTPSLATGNSIQYHLGASASAFNSEVMFFNYNGSGSNTNSIGFSLYGQPQVMNITGTGVGINNTNPQFSLDVSGSGRFTSNINLSGGSLNVSGASGSTGIDLSTSDKYASMRVIRNNTNVGDKDMFIQFQAGTTSTLHMYSNNTETMTLYNNNVGINTNSPSYTLDVNGSSRIQSNNNGVPNNFLVSNINSGSSAYSIIQIGNDTGNNLNMFLNSSTRTADGNTNTATIRNDAGSLRLACTGTNNYIYVSSSGIGINTISPSFTLDVNGSFRANGGGTFGPSASPFTSMSFLFQNSNTQRLEIGIAGGNSAYSYAATQGDCVIRTNGTNLLLQTSSGAPNIYVSVGGNVGINTGTTNHTLEVNGTFQASGYCYLGGGTTSNNATLLVLSGSTGDQVRMYANGLNGATGYFYYNSANTYGTISDKRIKTNINNISVLDSENFIKSLNPVSFEIINSGHKSLQCGFIAQEILGACVNDAQKSCINKWETYDENDPDCEYIGVSDRPIVSNLVGALKSAFNKIEFQQNQIDLLTQFIKSKFSDF